MIALTILCPSRGGIGIRLNTAKTQLIIANVVSNVYIQDSGLGFNSAFIPAASSNSRMFDTGPARETRAVSLSLLSKLYSFIGTGLLHPNLKISIEIAPIGSICDSGFRVSLPAAFAVGSPNFIAAQACAYS